MLPIALQASSDVGTLLYTAYIFTFFVVGMLSLYWIHSTYARVKRMEKTLEEIRTKALQEGQT